VATRSTPATRQPRSANAAWTPSPPARQRPIHGGKDDDTIHAGSGDDGPRPPPGSIFGEGGNDTLFGEKSDTLDSGGDDIWAGDDPKPAATATSSAASSAATR
jgi:hypothetical protein